MTRLFDWAVLLLGEIGCGSRLGLEGLTTQLSIRRTPLGPALYCNLGQNTMLLRKLYTRGALF